MCPTPHSLYFGGGALGEDEAGKLRNGLSALQGDSKEFLPHVMIWEVGILHQEEDFHQNPSMLTQWSGTSSLQSCDK